MNSQRLFIRATGLAAVLSIAAMVPAWASSHQAGSSTPGDHGKPTVQATSADVSDGEVRKIDKEAGKVTLKHGELKSIDMPPMTMVFVVQDKAMLDKLKAGDKVKFKAINDGGKFTVTEIVPVNR